MKLAKEETLIKEWEYAKASKKGQTSHSKLIVTDKRIVADTRGMGKVERQEIPMSAVKGIGCAYEKPSPVAGIIMIILGIALFIVGIVLMVQGVDGEMDETTGIMLMFVFWLFGIGLLVGGLNLLTKSAFVLEITTYGGEGQSLMLGASNLNGKNKRKAGTVKVQVDNHVVSDIIETLGLIITEHKKAE
ncbi:MAG: hypothetical protein IJ506_04390 [Clostridia bacterium]|nr:hypothetical protein [Clostridia bacterium]